MPNTLVIARWKPLIRRAAESIAVALSILVLAYSAGLARSREVRVVFLDTSAVAHFDFGVAGFSLTPEERTLFEAALRGRLEDEYSHWNVRFTFQKPASGPFKTVRFVEGGLRERETRLGFSLGFWGGPTLVFLDGESVAPFARDTALQLRALREIPLSDSAQRQSLRDGRIRTLAASYSAIAAHETAHAFGVVGHYGGHLMDAEPKLSEHLGTMANWMIALSLG